MMASHRATTTTGRPTWDKMNECTSPINKTKQYNPAKSSGSSASNGHFTPADDKVSQSFGQLVGVPDVWMESTR